MKCPLCGTRIPGNDKEALDFPRDWPLSAVLEKADAKGSLNLLTIIFSIAAVVAVGVIALIGILSEVFLDGYWISISSIVFSWITVLLFLLLKTRIYGFIAAWNALLISFFLILSLWIPFGSWMMNFILPAAGLHLLLQLGLAAVSIKYFKGNIYLIISAVLAAMMILVTAIEVLIDLQIDGTVQLFWSVLTAVAFGSIIVTLLLIQRWLKILIHR